MNDSVIKGEYINIEELPIGCVVWDTVTNRSVVIGSMYDINILIKSLEKLKGGVV